MSPEPQASAAAGPRVSIIVCAYNAAVDIAACLESLADQDYPRIEIVVVDDASTDGTADATRRFQSRTDVPTDLVVNTQNRGVAASRNAGVRRARGEILAFTDSDCLAERSWISELIEGFDRSKAAAVGGSISDPPRLGYWERVDKSSNHVARSEGRVEYIQGCNMAFDARRLAPIVFDDEIKYGYEEALLCRRLIAAGETIYYRPQAVVIHKHRRTFRALCRQKYLRGWSSIWYRKKIKGFPLLKRHLVLLLAAVLLPAIAVARLFGAFALLLLAVFSLSLARDEIRSRRKSFGDILITFPGLVAVEFAHAAGSISGLLTFRLFGRAPSPGSGSG